MNLHEVKITSQHELFGDFSQVPAYWCSCGWKGHGITEHAIANGIITSDGALFYCKSHDRGTCNRIVGTRGFDCQDHQR